MKAILVVEDEGLIADDIRRRLERLGYRVPAVASSGEEALRIARSREFDLVLMDIRLKGNMDGIAAAQQIFSELRVPVVYLTAHADEDTISRATMTEPFGYILKPVADGNLRSAVQIALYKHEMERRLRASEAWLTTTLRSIGDGIIATDPDGGVQFLNAGAERLTGWTAESAAGRPLSDVLKLRVEATGEPARNPVCDLFPEEVRAYELGGSPVEVQCFDNSAGGESLGAVVVVRDIRERRESEALRAQSQATSTIAQLMGGLEEAPREAIDVNEALADLIVEPVKFEPEATSGIIHAQPGRIRELLAMLATPAARIESSVLDLDSGHPLARRYGGTWFVKLRFSGRNRAPRAIVHAIVQQGGGQIACSEDAVEILWPCIGVHAGGPPSAALLLVEEEDSLRRQMVAAVESEGVQVLAVKTSGHAALIARAYRDSIRLLIAASPLDGFDIPMLRIAGYRHDHPLEPGSLAKPFPIGEFRRRVRELAARA